MYPDGHHILETELTHRKRSCLFRAGAQFVNTPQVETQFVNTPQVEKRLHTEIAEECNQPEIWLI
jgi:hypothetical protein